MRRRPKTTVTGTFEVEELFRKEGPGYVPVALPNGDEVAELEFTATFSAYHPGRLYGPPEDCFPPEGGELEDLHVRYDGQMFDCDGLWVKHRGILGFDDQRLPTWGDKWTTLEQAIGEYAAERAADGAGDPEPDDDRLASRKAGWLAG